MIHPTAIIDPGAHLGNNVSVGAYSIIGPSVVIGDDTIVDAHVIIKGPTEIGKGCSVFPFSSLGDAPQDLKYKGSKTRLVIGDGTIVREYVTINRGTEEGGGITSVGSTCFLMAYTHIAHDCTINDYVIMANGATLAGHIHIDSYAIIGGLVAIHQFVNIGSYAFIGGCSAVSQDVPPFCLAAGNRARLYGLNLVGLRRHNFSPETIRNLKQAYKILFRSGLILKEAIVKTEETIKDSPEVEQLLTFIKTSKRGIHR
ncbi:MAG TPA: acyl-ACP--UDP-N-acetylglucosamine O-acyltransferase [Thermodesulfobacteriota bacterium]|nr:acyl-ACP--UDP-N-acetylglucosamine O-acyltransferase [Thermodesulfobacteriota bacterium]HNU70946.1 acyl-ACP--UDP-N-acetylglucosamine O-acyltransferase [Thermodesulfobacteriota bacterium]HOC38309.1 acyl-ACP--UDP-N-acetylglucosamine O-acyltransferase [Thermodesulfobacteriota bacterium]HQO78167.1 acyl-ACP--UDP-N-acetylglucosamine O-acyltransferase [Thermodesulfobacteriota bacterium]